MATRERKSPADRLLDVAASLFPREGVRAVGIDRLLSEADVARASLYHSFGSKDGLVVAYLQRQHRQDQIALHRAVSRCPELADKLLTPFDLAERSSLSRGIFGCLYLNAAAEYSDVDHPVIQAVREHRDWAHRCWVDTLKDADAPNPEELADELQLLYEGGLAGAQLLRDVEPIRRARRMAGDSVVDTVTHDR